MGCQVSQGAFREIKYLESCYLISHTTDLTADLIADQVSFQVEMRNRALFSSNLETKLVVRFDSQVRVKTDIQSREVLREVLNQKSEGCIR